MSKPYDEYLDGVLDELEVSDVDIDERIYETRESVLRSLLADAWMDGLKYSLVMIESEKRTRDTAEALQQTDPNGPFCPLCEKFVPDKYSHLHRQRLCIKENGIEQKQA